MTQRYLDATNDVAFKKVFSHKEILTDFLNSVLRLPEGKKIEELHFVPQEEIPDLGQGKRSIFDIMVRDQSDFWYIVEMQNRPDELFLKRVQVYAASVHSNQLLKGKDYGGVMPVVVVSIVNGVLFPKEIECINRHTTREEKTNTQHLFELSYVFVELGKFIKKEEELDTIEDFWLFYLSKSTEVKHPPAKVKDKNILKAYEVLERLKSLKEGRLMGGRRSDSARRAPGDGKASAAEDASAGGRHSERSGRHSKNAAQSASVSPLAPPP